MIKRDELSDPTSCLNRVEEDEPVFVLRAADMCAPDTILFWILSRLTAGRNQEDDTQIKEAQALATDMVKYRAMKKG